ncbi:hypothetical protein F7725_012977 [Dissostichus mawsoni]|uniref:NADH dehydrogenase [ubiquinone] 1 alpha subcomplex subunit 12 n=1 Tax=Dissostichus mawsoni TaxID=36200 RepID=A0A7J5YP72_DISMA|nr:hypothetical protein F7725_012977 [Dissostichus mawsoni]
MNRVAVVLRRTFGIVREHVGTDHVGNKYYHIPEQKTWTGRLVRSRRMVVAANVTEYEYVEGSIPTDVDPRQTEGAPSVEELLKNQSYRDNIKIKAREVEEKDLILQAKEYEDGLVTTPAKTLAKGHAASTDFGKQEISEDPSSTANTFQPGSWLPKK